MTASARHGSAAGDASPPPADNIASTRRSIAVSWRITAAAKAEETAAAAAAMAAAAEEGAPPPLAPPPPPPPLLAPPMGQDDGSQTGGSGASGCDQAEMAQGLVGVGEAAGKRGGGGGDAAPKPSPTGLTRGDER